VILEVTNRWRDFDRALSSYQIQKRSVDLAQKRVESTELLLNAGRAIMRDVLDAREDLLDAQNRASQALVDLRVSTLELERDMDILVVDENGQLQEGAGYNDIQD
jgi:outer membrane protein TolC